MPTIQRGDATLYYEAHGEGFPILAFAPMGLQSTIAVWGGGTAPINPMTDFTDRFRVIVMDQRNAGGRSHAPISAKDGWDTFTADHLAVLDDLKIDRCHLYGQCIGGSFIVNMLEAQPQRVAAAVLAQPIGRVAPELPPRTARFDAWAESMKKERPDLTEAVLDAFYRNLYASGFVYAANRAFVSSISTPCLVLAGNDEAHPMPIAEELAKLIPKAEFIREWKTGDALASARARVKEFLAKHTP